MASMVTDYAKALFWATQGSDSRVDLKNDSFKMMLVTSSYTPTATHKYVADLTPGSNELSGTGYVAGFNGAGRKALTGNAVAPDNTNHVGYFSTSSPTWAGLNCGTAKYAVIIKEVTSDAASIIVAIVDIGSYTSNGNDFTVTCPATDGWLYY